MAEEQKKEIVLTKNNQPIKEICYQDMYLLNDTFDLIQSWVQSLSVINDFFGNRGVPLNKKKLFESFMLAPMFSMPSIRIS